MSSIVASYEELQTERNQLKLENLKLKAEHQKELDQLKEEHCLKGLNMWDNSHVLLYLHRCLSVWFYNKKQNCPPELAQVCAYQTMKYKDYVRMSGSIKDKELLFADDDLPVFLFDLEGDGPDPHPVNLQLPLSHFPDPNKVLVLHGCFPREPANGKNIEKKLSRWARFKKSFFSTF
jgi:hypothetical protein